MIAPAAHLLDLLVFTLLAGWPLPLATRLSRRAGPGAGEAWLLGALVWLTAQIGLSTALGLCGWLRPEVLIPAATVLGVLGLRVPAPPAPEREDDPLARPFLLLLAATGLILLWECLVHVSTDHDTLNYHLPAVAQFVQDGHLTRLPAWRFSASYPFAWELLNVPTVFAFDEDLLSGAQNVGAWALLGLAVHLLARRLGASRAVARVGVALMLALPHLLTRLDSLQVDVIFAAVFVSACVCVLEWRRGRDPLWAAAALACAGLMAGFRLSGAVYWVATLGLLLAPDPSTATARPRPRALVPLALGLGAALLVGGVWYLRNLVELGNPFGDIEVEIAGRQLFAGRHAAEYMRGTTLAHALSSAGAADRRDLWDLIDGALGLPLRLALGLGGVALLGLGTRAGRAHGARLLLVLGLAAAAGALYLIGPFSGNPAPGERITPWAAQAVRYLYPAFALLCAAAAAGVERLRLPAPLVEIGAAVVLILGLRGEIDVRPLLAVFAALLALDLLRRRGRVPRLTAAALILLFIIGGSLDARRDREMSRRDLFRDGYVWLEEKAPESVGVLYSTRMIQYYGRDLRRRVVDLEGRGRSAAAWLDAARAAEVPMIGLGPLPADQIRAMDATAKGLTRARSSEGRPVVARRYSGNLGVDIVMLVLR